MDTPDRSGYYVVIIVFIVIFVFFVYVVLIADIDRGSVRIDCAPGQCITNIFTGEKDCPSDQSAILSIDPVNEVCNSPFTCESSVTPFALQSDGSTNPDGVCPEGSKCRCLQRAQCARYVTAYFTPINGNPFQPIGDQRISFVQVTSYIDLANTFQEEPPLSVGSLDFCAVPNEWVEANRIWPSTCVRGTLAFVPEDPASFSPDDFDVVPQSCVIGPDCPTDTVAFWDNRVGSVMCLSTV